jgi:hypothetical protein
MAESGTPSRRGGINETIRAKLTGHYRYYGVTDNSRARVDEMSDSKCNTILRIRACRNLRQAKEVGKSRLFRHGMLLNHRVAHLSLFAWVDRHFHDTKLERCFLSS